VICGVFYRFIFDGGLDIFRDIYDSLYDRLKKLLSGILE
jgi:hypothetical protein